MATSTTQATTVPAAPRTAAPRGGRAGTSGAAGPMALPVCTPAAATLLGQARLVLDEAVATPDVGERFRLAHLAALRAAAAVLAERGRPASARRRLISVWVLIDSVAPEYSDWARYFAAGAPLRAAVEAGALHAVSAREADDQLRAAQDFVRVIERSLGMLAPPLAS